MSLDFVPDMPVLDMPVLPAGPGTDQPALRLVQGDGIVARQAGLVLLCGDDPRATALLDTLADVVAAGGDGAELCRRLAHLISARGDSPPVCAFGPAAGGLAVLVSGSAVASLTGPAGAARLAGRDSLTCVDRLLPGDVTLVSATVGDEPGAPDPWARLESGTARASAVVTGEPAAHACERSPGIGPVLNLTPAQLAGRCDCGGPVDEAVPVSPAVQATRPAAAATPSVTQPEPPSAQPPAASPGSGSHPAGCTCAGCAAPDAGHPAGCTCAGCAAPGAGRPDGCGDTTGAVPEAVVLGLACTAGHFNDPRVPYCTGCGMSMVQVTSPPQPGVRPPLGVLVLDDGTTYPLDQGYVLGRDPARDELVGEGRYRPLALGMEGSVSRVHARIDIDGWDVVLTDTGSTNGTYVWSEPDGQWFSVPPTRPVVIRPGTWVRIGPRALRYTSHRGV